MFRGKVIFDRVYIGYIEMHRIYRVEEDQWRQLAEL